MCGICGVYGIEDKKLLTRMTDKLKHRGPDDKGYFTDKDIMLGHRRLSIIDLNTGAQPIFNEDKSIVIIFNGEIYNYIELRTELEKKGHRFSTSGDTEVIVHAYEEYGEKCLHYLNGMFAFAIWDSNKKKLFIARDRVGIKPLFYTQVGKLFLFGSEIKAILEFEGVARNVDIQAFHHFINLRYNPGTETMFQGIYKLAPAHYMVIDKKGVTTKKYWDLPLTKKEKSEAYYLKALDRGLDNAVKLQLRSDVPVGVLLSSGLDSTSLVAHASRHVDSLKTFTMGFDEPDDECRAAQKISEHFGFDHTNIIISGDDILRDFPKMIYHMDQPKRNIYVYYMYEEMAKRSKVILSGLGGDELLGGYVFRYKYMFDGKQFRNRFAPNNALTKLLRVPARHLIDAYVKLMSNRGNVIKDGYLKKLSLLKATYADAKVYSIITTADAGFDQNQFKFMYGKKMKGYEKEYFKPFEKYFKNFLLRQINPNYQGLSLLDKTFMAEFKEKLPNDFLCMEDTMSMAWSVEARVPFFDNDLIDLCFGMPNKYKLVGEEGKVILRKHLTSLMPKSLLPTKKQGFASNTYSIYKKELHKIARDKLINSNAVREGLINKKFVEKIVNIPTNIDKTRYYNFLWNLYAFDLWYDIYLNDIPYTKIKN